VFDDVSGYRIYAFTATGSAGYITFQKPTTIDVLVIGGGGASGLDTAGTVHNTNM
jgi:hypothetical protein